MSELIRRGEIPQQPIIERPLPEVAFRVDEHFRPVDADAQPRIDAVVAELTQLAHESTPTDDLGTPQFRVLESGLFVPDSPVSRSPEDASAWSNEVSEKAKARTKRKAERLARESLKGRDPNLERHLFLSDYQIPDHNVQAIKAVDKFIADFAPNTVHLVGDMLNFTRAGTYSVDERYDVGLDDEIHMGREVINDLVEKVRTANPDARIIWYEGNHEYRLHRYLARQAPEVRDLTDEKGMPVVSVPSLFRLGDRNIEWVPYYDSHQEGAKTEVEHGDIARSKAGYTAQGMLDRRGTSGYSGHTHKLALVSRRTGGETKFWVETGSLCNPEPNPKWTKKPDWVNGFAVGIYDKQEDIMHPTAVLMQRNQFAFDGKIYKP